MAMKEEAASNLPAERKRQAWGPEPAHPTLEPRLLKPPPPLHVRSPEGRGARAERLGTGCRHNQYQACHRRGILHVDLAGVTRYVVGLIRETHQCQSRRTREANSGVYIC